MRPHLIAGVVLALGVALLVAGILVGPPTVDFGSDAFSHTTPDGTVEGQSSFYVTGPVYDALSPNDGNTLMGAGVALIAVAVVGEIALVVRRRRT